MVSIIAKIISKFSYIINEIKLYIPYIQNPTLPPYCIDLYILSSNVSFSLMLFNVNGMAICIIDNSNKP